jgi:hypothetical protein
MTRALHPARGVDGVAEETIMGHPLAHDSCANWPRVDPDSHLQLVVGLVLDREATDGVQYGQREKCDFACVDVTVSLREPGDHHVSVADGFHLKRGRIRC